MALSHSMQLLRLQHSGARGHATLQAIYSGEQARVQT